MADPRFDRLTVIAGVLGAILGAATGGLITYETQKLSNDRLDRQLRLEARADLRALQRAFVTNATILEIVERDRRSDKAEQTCQFPGPTYLLSESEATAAAAAVEALGAEALQVVNRAIAGSKSFDILVTRDQRLTCGRLRTSAADLRPQLLAASERVAQHLTAK